MRVNDALDQRYMTKWGLCVCVCVLEFVRVIAGRALTIEDQRHSSGRSARKAKLKIRYE